jgi:hypothetical protein
MARQNSCQPIIFVVDDNITPIVNPPEHWHIGPTSLPHDSPAHLQRARVSPDFLPTAALGKSPLGLRKRTSFVLRTSFGVCPPRAQLCPANNTANYCNIIIIVVVSSTRPIALWHTTPPSFLPLPVCRRLFDHRARPGTSGLPPTNMHPTCPTAAAGRPLTKGPCISDWAVFMADPFSFAKVLGPPRRYFCHEAPILQ